MLLLLFSLKLSAFLLIPEELLTAIFTRSGLEVPDILSLAKVNKQLNTLIKTNRMMRQDLVQLCFSTDNRKFNYFDDNRFALFMLINPSEEELSSFNSLTASALRLKFREMQCMLRRRDRRPTCMEALTSCIVKRMVEEQANREYDWNDWYHFMRILRRAGWAPMPSLIPSLPSYSRSKLLYRLLGWRCFYDTMMLLPIQCFFWGWISYRFCDTISMGNAFWDTSRVVFSNIPLLDNLARASIMLSGLHLVFLWIVEHIL